MLRVWEGLYRVYGGQFLRMERHQVCHLLLMCQGRIESTRFYAGEEMSFTKCCNRRFIGDNHSPIQPDGYCLFCGFHPEIQKLQHQLEIQTKRVENLKKSNKFYSNEENWTIDGHTHEEETYYVREDGEFSVTIRGDVDPSYRYGGKLARECQAIDQELEKQLEEMK